MSPLEGSIRVVDHPNNAPAAGFPDLRGKVIDRVAADPQTSTSILDRNKFRSALFGEICDVIPRNSLFGDGITTVDPGVYKTFRLKWGHDFTVRFEAYNAFNDVQYGFPVADLGNANFGRLQSGAVTYAPRTLQVGCAIATDVRGFEVSRFRGS